MQTKDGMMDAFTDREISILYGCVICWGANPDDDVHNLLGKLTEEIVRRKYGFVPDKK